MSTTCPHCDEYRNDYRIAVDGLLEARKQIAALQSALATKDAALEAAAETLKAAEVDSDRDIHWQIRFALQAGRGKG